MLRRRSIGIAILSRWRLFAALFGLTLALSACGDRAELPEKAYVMGIALDESDKGSIELTVQIFRPSQTIGKGKTGKSYVTVRTEDHSVLEAIRDITIHLGRKAQWSHMRVILVGERLARKVSMPRLLDFFYRDHEPRLTSHLLITQGRASSYLDKSPYIENTISQQFFLSEKASSRSSGKTPSLSLLDLALQTKGKSATALVPYLYINTLQGMSSPSVAGAAALIDGKLRTIVPSTSMEGVMLLNGNYKSGIVEVPCADARNTPGRFMAADSVEILRTANSRRHRIVGDRVHIVIEQKAFVVLSELECERTDTMQDERKFVERTAEAMKTMMSESFDWLKKNRIDALGIGNWVYGHAPGTWKRWQADWPQRFSETTFEIRVNVILLSTGTTVGEPKFPD